jgi:type VI secretion system protein ImpC
VPVADDVTVPVSFAELDDFHPDRLFARLEPFRALRELRADLADPSTFEKAAARLRSWASPACQEQEAPAPEPSRADPAALLEQILGQAPAGPGPRDDWQAFLRKAVAPHLVPGIDQARHAELEAVVDEAAAARMRALLHHPDFRAVEAAWRSAWFLVRRLETDSLLQVHLLDVSKAGLAADLLAGDDLAATATYRLFAEPPGGQPWALLVGLYPFGPAREDVELLGWLARLARRAGAPFVAEGSPRLLGSPSLAAAPGPADWQPLAPEEEQAWQALRQLPEAAHLGLALPRFLLRLPYGREASSVEQFHFEELDGGAGHEAFLWGSPGVLCACLLGEAFSRRGWDLGRALGQEVGGLPVCVYRADGESRALPCAEVALGERAVAAILERGLMPVLSLPGADAIRLPRMQSLAVPARLLAGRWAGG